jgi:DNA ligase-4
MLETKLARQLEKILGLQGLKRWDAVGWGDEGTGCLGLELERVLKERVSLLPAQQMSSLLQEVQSC